MVNEESIRSIQQSAKAGNKGSRQQLQQMADNPQHPYKEEAQTTLKEIADQDQED